MSIDTEVKPIHNEIAKHIKKETGKGVRPESVALVLDGARDYRAGEKERVAAKRAERKAKQISDLKAKLAALTGEVEEAEKVAKAEVAKPITPKKKAEAKPEAENVTPITKKRGAAKKAATPAPKKAEPESETIEDDFEDGIENTPEGALPIEVIESDDVFETPDDEDDEDEWDVDGDDDEDEDAEDF